MNENLEILLDKLNSILTQKLNVVIENDILSDYYVKEDVFAPFTFNPNEELNTDFLNLEYFNWLTPIVCERITYSDDPKYYHQIVKIVGDYLVNKDIKQQLKFLSNLLTKLSKKYNKKANSILHNITLLFGLCSHKLSYIFNAFFGTTSARIFSF